MLFGTLSLVPVVGSPIPDLAIEINGLRHSAEGSNIHTHRSLVHFAERKAEITIVTAEMDNDVTERQDEYPGGHIQIEQFYTGHLTYDASSKCWRKPDGLRLVDDRPTQART